MEYAHKAGISFFLDFHQDLYGVAFGLDAPFWADGAPAWATITDGLPHVAGDLWSGAYLISPALNRAFEHFWNNDPLCWDTTFGMNPTRAWPDRRPSTR